MALIDYKSTLSNYRRVIKPKADDTTNSAPVDFGEYKPISNNLPEYQDDRYQFSTKKLESFERKKIGEPFTTDSILKNDSIFDNVDNTKKNLLESKVVNNTQEPYTEIKTKGNNEKSPIVLPPTQEIDNKEIQAKTISPVNQEDRTSGLVSKYEREIIKKNETKNLEKLKSTFNTDNTINQSTPSGRYESEKQSRFGFIGNDKPETNMFSDKYNNGFKIKNGSGFTTAAFEYSWAGGSTNAPSVSGFSKFAKMGVTEFDVDELPQTKEVDAFSNKYSKNFTQNQTETRFTDEALNFTKPQSVNYFRDTYSKNFKINAKQFETSFTDVALEYGSSLISSTNFFDINKNYTNSGFLIKQKIYETDFNQNALDWGLQGNLPKTNYFDTNKIFSLSGFAIKQKQYETDFNSYALDYGLRGLFPTVNYFDLNKSFTNNGFIYKQSIYSTDFNSSALDWGLKGVNQTTDFFDQSHKYTNSGFVFKQKIYETDFNNSALDWGLKGTNPATNYFDLIQQFTKQGFLINQQILATDFNSSALDWGLKGTNPTTNYFDQNKTYTNTGFTFKQQLLITDFNNSALDWGLKGTNPTTDYFDQGKQFTTTGFMLKQPLLTTDFNASALDWGLKGTNPTTDYFDQNKQFTTTGFTLKQPLLITDFNPLALDWGLKGINPTTDYFDQNKQFTTTGFTLRQPLFITDFNISALDWGLKGTNPTTDYFDQNKQFTTTGFTLRQPLLATDFNISALDWGLKGTNPTTDYFDQGKQFTISGFTLNQPLLTTDFNTSALDWGLKGTNPFTDYFDQRKQFTDNGFVIRQPILTTDFNPSALDWGLRGTNPSTDYFDTSHVYTTAGFVIRQGIYNTDFTPASLDYSLSNIPPLSSGFPSVNLTIVSNKQYAQTNFFDLQNQNTTRGFHVLARPLEPTSYKTNSTQFFTVPASDFEIPRLGSSVHKIDSQLVKSPIFLNLGFIKDNQNTYTDLIRTKNYISFLGDVATRRNSPSLLDIQYQKYSLQDDSVNYDISLLGRQPYITRGIQTKGNLENERWGFGINFDDGLIRGGAVTVADRTVNDVLRLTKWSTSTKGLLYNIKQIGLQLSNPNTEAGVLGPTKIYQPLSPLLAAGTTALGQHPPRHGLIPFVTSGRYEDVIKDKKILFETDPNLSNRNIQAATELSLLSSDKRVIIPITAKPTGNIIETLSGLTGPGSVYGIGVTNFYRNDLSIPYDAYIKYSPDINPLFTPGRYIDYQNSLLNTYDISDVRFNRNVELASELGFFQDWYELPFDKNPNSSKFYFGQGIRRISGEPQDSTKIHRFSVSIPDNALQKYSTTYQYASPFSISLTKSRDRLSSEREWLDSSGATSMLRNIYLAFQGEHNISPLFKTNKNSPDKHILNFGIDGSNDSVQYIRSLGSRIFAIYPSSLDVYSPHTVRNPMPYSFGGDGDALSFGAWSKDKNVNRPFISELEQYGIISKRLKGFYAPEKMTLGKNVTDTRTSLRLYNIGYEESPTVTSVSRATVGPLSETAREDREQGKLKLSRLYDIMVEYAKKYKSPNDVFNAEFQNFSSYDDDDNIDIKFYVKNLLNPLNKVIEDVDYISSDNRFININKRVNTEAATTPEYIYKPNSLKEYSSIAYTDIPNGYTDLSRTAVSIGPAPVDSFDNDFQGQPVDRTRELNNRRFFDFRYKIHSFTQKEEGNVFPKSNGRVNFVTNPEIIKYRSNNIEDAAGYGKHGLPGVDRTNPVLSFLCGRVSQGVRQINGEQYGGSHLFRGDRVNLVDFRHDKSTTDLKEIYEMGENSLIPGKKDLIEFYVTGTGKRDRVIVFRASINEVNDNFNPSWETIKYLNRADPVYLYKGFEREVSVTFDIGITSRDELRTRWRSLNALAGFTAPEYINSIDPSLNGRMKAPLMKLTLGHLFRATPCVITSLNYTFDNSQVVWETAKLTRWVNGQEIEETITTNDLDDPACCVALQLPKMIKVSMTLKVIGNYRPQSNGGVSGYPDMGIFYQLYASDDSANDGQLPRKGGIYVNYFNRECTVVKLPEEQPKQRETIEEEIVVKEEEIFKEEIKRNQIETVPEEEPKKAEEDDQKKDQEPIKAVEEEDYTKGEGPAKKRQGPTNKRKPRRQNSDGALDTRATAPEWTPPNETIQQDKTYVYRYVPKQPVSNPRTAAGQLIDYP